MTPVGGLSQGINGHRTPFHFSVSHPVLNPKVDSESFIWVGIVN